MRTKIVSGLPMKYLIASALLITGMSASASEPVSFSCEGGGFSASIQPVEPTENEVKWGFHLEGTQVYAILSSYDGSEDKVKGSSRRLLGKVVDDELHFTSRRFYPDTSSKWAYYSGYGEWKSFKAGRLELDDDGEAAGQVSLPVVMGPYSNRGMYGTYSNTTRWANLECSSVL